VALVLAVPFPSLTAGMVLLAALVGLTQPSNDPLLWYLRGIERLDLEASIVLSWRLINASLLAVLAWSGFSLEPLLAAWLASNAVRMAAASRIAALRDMRTAPKPGTQLWKAAYQAIRQAAPIGLAFVLM